MLVGDAAGGAFFDGTGVRDVIGIGYSIAQVGACMCAPVSFLKLNQIHFPGEIVDIISHTVIGGEGAKRIGEIDTPAGIITRE